MIWQLYHNTEMFIYVSRFLLELAYYTLFQNRNTMQIIVHWTSVRDLVKREFHKDCAILIKYVRIRYSEQENMPLIIPRAFRSVQKCNVSKKTWKSTTFAVYKHHKSRMLVPSRETKPTFASCCGNIRFHAQQRRAPMDPHPFPYSWKQTWKLAIIAKFQECKL